MNYQVSKKTELSLQNLEKLSRIYISKNWSHINENDENEYDTFCEMLTYLDSEQQNFIVNLTQDFLRITSNEYIHYFKMALFNYVNSYCNTGKHDITLVPLIRQEDIHKSKSSIPLYYLVKDKFMQFSRIYSTATISGIDNIISIREILDNIHEFSHICLIDDYIGTGETAVDAVNYLHSLGVSIDKIGVIALVAQKSGLEKISTLSVKVAVAVERVKGITDSGEEVNKKISIMQSIETKMKIKPSIQFGYKGSEALVKMMRTPNNTFPIYWHSCKNVPVVPFPRYAK